MLPLIITNTDESRHQRDRIRPLLGMLIEQ
jgi:hypothetical protein